MKNKKIMLSGRQYTIQDIGEGPPCIFLIHQYSKAAVPLTMLVDQIRDHYRLIILDITDYFPTLDDSISELKLDQLIEDLHLLCDIYWLKKVVIRSDYQSDLIQFKFKTQLLERYQSDWELELHQPEKQHLSLH